MSRHSATRERKSRRKDSTHARHNELVAELQRATFAFFDEETNHDKGLVRDSTKQGSPATIAGSGLGLTCCVVAAERGYLPRSEVASRVRATLDFFWTAEQSESPNSTGYKGFFYHYPRSVVGCDFSPVRS